MGDKWQVWQWVLVSYGPMTRGMKFDWDFFWGGSNHKTAIKKAKIAKLKGAGFVKIEWR